MICSHSELSEQGAEAVPLFGVRAGFASCTNQTRTTWLFASIECTPHTYLSPCIAQLVKPATCTDCQDVKKILFDRMETRDHKYIH